MASQLFIVDTYNLYVQQGDIQLTVDTINVALVADFTPSYNIWQASTSYSQGDIVIPSTRNGRRYRATNAGTSGSSEPSWPTSAGGTVVDNDITWEEYGGEYADKSVWGDVSGNEASGTGYTAGGKTIANGVLGQVSGDPAVTMWDADNITWTGLNATFMTGWIYKSGGTSPADPILGYILFDDTPASISIGGSDFTIQWSTLGIFLAGRKPNV